MKKVFDTIFPKPIRTQILAKALTVYYKIKARCYFCKNINYPEIPCVFAMWHGQQCGIFTVVKEKQRTTYLMVSNSNDGEIAAQASKGVGLGVIRGSYNRKGASAALGMIDAIKKGNNGALMVDGPRGPKHVAKRGVVEIARLSECPIVPVAWYSPSPFLLKFKSWDDFRFPLNFIRMKALFGDPIYVPMDSSDEELENIRLKVESELHRLNDKLIEEYKTL